MACGAPLTMRYGHSPQSKPHEDSGMSAKRLDIGIVIRPVQAVVRQMKQAQIEDDARAVPEAMSHATSGLQQIIEPRPALWYLHRGVRRAEPTFHKEGHLATLC